MCDLHHTRVKIVGFHPGLYEMHESSNVHEVCITRFIEYQLQNSNAALQDKGVASISTILGNNHSNINQCGPNRIRASMRTPKIGDKYRPRRKNEAECDTSTSSVSKNIDKTDVTQVPWQRRAWREGQ